MSSLSPNQFHEYIDETGYHPIDREAHRFGRVPIERLRENDLARLKGTELPFQRVAGPSIHDPSHPSDTSQTDPEFPTRMFVASFPRSYSPHQPEGTHFEVYRKRS